MRLQAKESDLSTGPRIALDITCTEGTRTGVGVYAANLVEWLVKSHLDSRFLLYAYSRSLDVRAQPGLFFDLSNVHYYRWRRSQLASAIKWTALGLDPVEKYLGHVNIVHGLFHLIPATRSACKVVTVYDLTPYLYPETGRTLSNLYHWFAIARSVALADAVVTISNSDKGEICSRLGVSESKVTVAYPGLDIAIWRPRKVGEWEGDFLHAQGIHKPYVVFLGTIQPRKDVKTLLDAYVRVRQLLENKVQLVLVGGTGWKCESVLGEVQRLSEAHELVHVAGADVGTVAVLVRHAQALVQPSIYEGFGMPLAEAMASGCPVIASDIPVFREVLGNAGLFYSIGNSMELADRICRIITDKCGSEALRVAGLSRSSIYSWERCASKVWSLYERLLSS